MRKIQQSAKNEEEITSEERTDFSRREDVEILTGRRNYAGTDDEPDDTLYAAIYRSPHAHATIENIDISNALKIDGVVGGMSGDSLPDYVLPLSPFPFQETDPFQTDGNPAIQFFDHYPLATDKVRFVGEPVAVVVAEDPYVAHDAVERIEAEYDSLPAVVNEEEALESDDVLLYEDWGNNKQLEFKVWGGDVKEAFENADHVFDEKIKHHRFSGTPMEPRAVVAEYDPDDQHLVLYDSTQIPHVITTVVEDSFDLPALKVEVQAEKIGGGFGQKWGFYPEEVLVPTLAMEFERPIKWVERRQEHMTSTSHAREQTHNVRVGANDDGEIVGLEDTVIANAGAAYPQGAPATHMTTSMFVPGAYKIQNYRCQLYGVATNKTPFGAHRGFGKSEAAFVIERLADILAEKLEMDPAELRHRNFIQPDEFPYNSVTGNRYDSGNYPKALDRALELADYEKWRNQQAEVREADNSREIGIGMSVCIEPSSSTRMGSYNAGYYTVRMRMDTGGEVFIYPEGSDMGQSHEITIAQIISSEIGIDESHVQVVQGNTEACPYGSGSYSSRFSVVGTSACYEAAERLGEKLKGIAAHQWDEPVSDLVLSNGEVQSTITARSMTMKEVARFAHQRIHDLPQDMNPGLEFLHYYRDPNIKFEADEQGRVSMFSAYPYAADVAIIEVDTRTGVFEIHDYVSVHDCGNILNPKIVEGQHLGALAHGFGGALYEQFQYDESGQPLNQTFVDYWVPSAKEIPDITLDHVETPNPFTPGGHKGTGETGTITPPPTFANAVSDALSHLDVEIYGGSPMDPNYIREKIRESSKA